MNKHKKSRMLKLPTKRVYQYITLKDIKGITKQGGIFLKAIYVKERK